MNLQSDRKSLRICTVAVLLCSLLAVGALLHAGPTGKSQAFADADADLSQFRLHDLETRLEAMPEGSGRDYFSGVLANRTGHTQDSIRLLNRALPAMRNSEPARATVALEALADDYKKAFRYDDAAKTYDDLLTHFAAQLGERLQGTRDDFGVMHLLKGVPAQTIGPHGPVRLKTQRNVIGSIVTDLDVNGVRGPWLLDTGANFSVVTRGFAKRLGLKPLPGFAQTTAGVTGIENPLQVAVLPTLQLTGVTLHNVVLLVLDDQSLNIDLGKQKYQINAIVGYPVFQALSTITFRQDGIFEAGDAPRSSADGARMFMSLLTPVIECGIEGQKLPFTFDTGASASNLSVRYYERFRADSGSWRKTETRTGGAGGIVTRTVYVQPKVNLTVGNQTATLTDVAIFPQKMGSDVDTLYGNLGQDLVAHFQSFTLDFTNMTFTLGPPRPDTEKR